MIELTDFGKRLKLTIKNAGHSQKKVCELWGISEDALGQYFKGKTFPKGDLLIKISETLNISIDWLLTGKEFASELTEDEIVMLESYRRCTQPNKDILKSTALALSGGSQEQAASSSTLKIG